MKMQVRVPRALAALHNFIRLDDLDDDKNAGDGDDKDDSSGPYGGVLLAEQHTEDDDGAKAWRDEIADEMWMDYLRYRQEQGLDSSDDDDIDGEESLGEGADAEDEEGS
jgi:hypothetical protein